MFKSKAAPSLPPTTDFTKNLCETSFYRYGHLRTLGLTGEITALAVDPVLSLFAAGTSSGVVHVFGQPAFQFSLPVGPQGIKFLSFHCGHNRLVVIDSNNTLHTYSLKHLTDNPNPSVNPPLPVKEGAYTLWSTITAVDQPLPSHTHLFITVKDGTSLAWDLSRHTLGSYRVGNCWGDYETKMVRSGMPGRRKTAGGPMATCIAVNPRDLNIMLLGYEGGVVAWDIQKGMVVNTYELIIPPGAPGGGSYEAAKDTLWTERTPSVTCVVWRPDGLAFAVGHSDGCIAIWAYSESDKPLMVRTITHEDVNIADADALFSAGALDTQIRKVERDIDGIPILPAAMANREPIFKLAWASFPDAASLKTLMAIQGTEAAGEPLQQVTIDYAERGETLLLILGGQSPGERPGINIIQFPAYTPPPPPQRKASTPTVVSEGMSLTDRYAFRDSLMPTGASNYPTRTPPEDFVLMPRLSPYFNLSHDPIMLIVSLTPDKTLSKTSAPSAERGIEVFGFPPQRSTTIPQTLGRKNWVTPGEGEQMIQMTPAPVMTRSNPGSPRAVSPGGWRLPWTTPSPQPSPGLRVPTPDSIMSVSAVRRLRGRKRLRLPSTLWSGHLTVLGCEIHSLPTTIFKRLISWSIETAGEEDIPRMPLLGGMAVPDLASHGAPDVKVAKMESYRLLMTFHPDASVRFWDISPHLLLLPTPLRFEYPGPLPHLTISIGEYLKHPDVAHLPLAKLWNEDKSKVKIKSVHLARESLEVIITMTTGELIVTKFGESRKKGGNSKPGVGNDGLDNDDIEELDLDDRTEGHLGSPDPSKDSYFPLSPTLSSSGQVPSGSGQGTPGGGVPGGTPGTKAEWVEEVLEIGHLARWNTDGFKPVAIFTLKRGEAVVCAVSDIGFIAVAFDTKSVAVLDMRGPDVILREGFDEDGVMMKRKKKKNHNVQNVVGESSVVGAMKWVIAGLGNDTTPRVRLIVSYIKGMTKIYSLVNVLGEWMVETKPPTFTNESLAYPIASWVIDPSDGNELSPSSEAFQASMKVSHESPNSKKDVPAHCIWIAASRKSIRAAVNFNGERIAKVEFEQDELRDVFYVTRHGQKIMVAITATGQALAYTMPFLNPIIRMDLFFGNMGRKVGKISFDDRSGDFIEYGGPLDINLRTLFHFRKPHPPRLDPISFKRAIPAQPTPLNASGLVGSWIWGGAPLTGAQLDNLIAGPKRPPMPKEPPMPKQPLITWGKPPPDEPTKAAPSPSTIVPKRTAVHKQKAPTRDAREREDVYSEMTNAANERGNYMDELGDHLYNATNSASNYLSQAKNAALKEAAKNTAKGMFGKLM